VTNNYGIPQGPMMQLSLINRSNYDSDSLLSFRLGVDP
jgi:hypothetical protein